MELSGSHDKDGYKFGSSQLAGMMRKNFADTMQQDYLPLDPTRFVGVGYNLIRGAPEGTFEGGGSDPGIKVAHHIHRFTYNQNKKKDFLNKRYRVPDQVNYFLRSSCTKTDERRAYIGSKSYQSNLAASISAEGTVTM